MKRNQLFAALLCAAMPHAKAQSAETLDEVVVTAMRIEQPLKQTLAHTTVISRKDIDASQAVDAPTLLRQLAGVEIYQSGNIGKQSSLFLRGTNSSHTLVLVDGVRLGSATTGATAIDQLMLDQIERIEVVRGNVSSLYGSDAIGGVIQIFTRQGRGEPRLNVQAGGGSYQARRLSAGYGGQTESASFNLQATRYFEAGYSALDRRIVPGANPDKDGYANTSFSGNWRQSFGQAHQLNLSAFETRGDVQYDNAFGTATEINTSKTRLNKLAVELDDRFAENWQSKLSWARGADELNTLTNGITNSRIKTVNDQWGWQNTFALKEGNTLLLGSEGQRQRVDGSTAYTRTSRNVTSYLAGLVSKTRTQQLQLNARQDRYSDFGAAKTWRFAYGMELSSTWRATYSRGTAFKAPTMNDLFYPYENYGWGYSYAGNPNLKPERAMNTEAGLHYESAAQQLDWNYFDNRITDLIVYNNQPAATMINLESARIKGWELAYRVQINATRWHASYTSQDPRNEQDRSLLLRRAREYANAGFEQQLETMQWGLDWQYSGVRQDVHITAWPTQRVALPAYSVVNLTARYALGRRSDLSLRVENLFDRDYTLAHGYATPGRTVFLSFNYH